LGDLAKLYLPRLSTFRFLFAQAGQEETPKAVADSSQARTVSVKPRQISPWFSQVIAHAVVFSIPIVIGYWIWHPLGVAAIIFALGNWASALFRAGITAYPMKACLLGRFSVVVVAGIWGCSVGLVVLGSTFYLHIANWAAILLFLWGWVAVGYQGWAEAPNLSQYANTTIWEVKSGGDDAREKLDRAVAASQLFERVRFFRLMSMAAYVGMGIPPIVKHFFWP